MTSRLRRGFGIVAKAVARSDLSLSAKALYLVLCSYADDEGVCYPSNETLANDLRTTSRSVQNWLVELVEADVIVRERRFDGERETTSTTRLVDAVVSYRGVADDTPGGEPSFTPGGEPPFVQNKTTRNRTTMNTPQRGGVADEPLLTLVDVPSPDGDGERKANPTTAAVDEAFDEWYALYPRKVKKIAARKAYGTAYRKVGPRVLIEAIRRQAPVYGKVNRYVPYPATWLNDGSWDDDVGAIRPDTRTREQRDYDEGWR